jgi:glycosyltransferase involved in cell wall biosynthesis
MKKTVGIIGTNGLPGRYGGWDQLVNHLTKNLRDKYSFLVYTSYTNAEPGLTEYNGAKLKIVKFKANGVQSIPYDIYSLIHAGFRCDVLYICGTSGCLSLPLIKLFRKKIILNPDGQEWKRKKWSKPVRWFLKISEKFGILFSDIVIADNKKIQEYITKSYNKSSVLIEYGGDHVRKVPMSLETSEKYDIKNNEYAFKVCRIEPENNIHLILEAFKRKPKVDIIIVGNWDYSTYGQKLKKKYSTFENLKLLDPIYDQVTLDELRSNCALYIHGHSVGGTNPSLVEAMNLGLCIVSFKIDYNIETTENKAIYFSDANDLINILNNYKNNLINVDAYKVVMKEIAVRRYKWDIITKKYSKIFK